ncbi:MAG: hypothetical protein J6112_03525 [Clostridia bacterium]|nr:hypothetical protein [Clostridia bacterium]
MKWVYDDGGRAEAGYKGTTGDCVCRAVAIAAERPYKEVYDLINEIAKGERTGKHKHKKSNARTCVYRHTERKLMEHYGFKWVPTMMIGSGCKVHLNEDELPSGRIVVALSKHLTAVVDGVIHDTYDPNDRGYTVDGYGNDITTQRCVYGYYIRDEKHYVGEIVSHKGHECIVTSVWNDDGKEGITIKPTGNYGFEVDIYNEQL